MLFKRKEKERIRVYHSVVSMTEEDFLAECASGTDGKGVNIYGARIGGVSSPYISFDMLLALHAQTNDPEAEDGPYMFMATRDGTVVFPVTETVCLNQLESHLVDTMKELVFNEDIVQHELIGNNQVIAVGAVIIGSHHESRGSNLTIDCHYVDPTMRG